MIKSFFFKLVQATLIVALVLAGGFVFIEESVEKKEKTELTEEVLHRSTHATKTKRALLRQSKKKKSGTVRSSKTLAGPYGVRVVLRDFNVNYIYTTSYLDQSFSI